MALSFTPKFVDMVRVTSTTQGTGPFVCGPAVQGFATFAESLAVGDSFYYSAQGADKPLEREVGRGTLQANGTIARQALRGTLTTFTSGSKIISLVAASEWFSEIQQAAGAAELGNACNTRAQLKALQPTTGMSRYLTEAGRAGTFIWDPLIPVAAHQADVAEGALVAPNATAAGAWVRRFDGSVNVRWFGAKGDGVTNDSAAFVAALAYLKATVQTGFGYGVGGTTLFVPKGHYFLGSTTLDIDFTLRIEGESIGISGGGSTALRWSAGTTGIRIQGPATTGAAGTKPTNYITGASLIRGLFLYGGYAHGTTAEGEFHAIQLRATAAVEDVCIRNWQGDGLHIVADINASSNANLSTATRVSIECCRNGAYLQGGDANACSFLHVNVSSNRQWGIWDRSFLGNSFFGCHSATNGTLIDSNGASVIPPNRARHAASGNVYAVVPGQEAWCSTNAPSGTSANNQGWLWLGAGAEQPWNNIRNWTSGTVYRSGGSYAATDPNARSVFMACYSEGDMAPCQIYARSMLQGGIHECGVKGQGAYIRGDFNGLWVSNNYLTASDGFIAKGDIRFGDDTKTFQQAVVQGSNYAALNFSVGYTAYGRVFGSTDFPSILRIDGANGVQIETTGSAVVGRFDTTGLDLATGKAFRIGGTQVLGARRTGWTAATGTAARGAFAAAAAGIASATYVQAEAQGALDRVAAAEARLIALESDIRAHGLIN